MSRTDKDAPISIRQIRYREVAYLYENDYDPEEKGETLRGREAVAEVVDAYRNSCNNPRGGHRAVPGYKEDLMGDYHLLYGVSSSRYDKRPVLSSTGLRAELQRVKHMFNGGANVDGCDFEEERVKLDSSAQSRHL